MKHFGIFLTDLESERFLTASNDQIATWLFLHAFCSKQMNSGTIKDATSLPERFWSRHGITASILQKPSPLWTWIDSDLSVEPYDIQGQELYLKKVKGGKIGNEKRWKGTDNRTPIRTLNPPNLTLPDQTRPDQTRPDQTRPDQTRPDQTSLHLAMEEEEVFSLKLTIPFRRRITMNSSTTGTTFKNWRK
jgi:hypothetical protein